MKKLFLIFLFFTSCKKPPETLYIEYDFIIKEKVKMDERFYIRSITDSVLRCSAEQVIGWDEGDTIPMKMALTGFMRGEHTINKK